MSCDVAGVEQDVVDRTVAMETTNTNESSNVMWAEAVAGYTESLELWSAPKWPNSICLFSL